MGTPELDGVVWWVCMVYKDDNRICLAICKVRYGGLLLGKV